MASIVQDATMTVTLEEKLVLNGKSHGSKSSFTLGSIDEVSQRILTVPSASEIIAATFGAAVAGGTYVTDNIRYIRVANLDDTNWVRLRMFVDADTDKIADILLQPRQVFVLGSPKLSDTAVFSAFANLTSIKLQANTADVDVELMIASV